MNSREQLPHPSSASCPAASRAAGPRAARPPARRPPRHLPRPCQPLLLLLLPLLLLTGPASGGTTSPLSRRRRVKCSAAELEREGGEEEEAHQAKGLQTRLFHRIPELAELVRVNLLYLQLNPSSSSVRPLPGNLDSRYSIRLSILPSCSNVRVIPFCALLLLGGAGTGGQGGVSALPGASAAPPALQSTPPLPPHLIGVVMLLILVPLPWPYHFRLVLLTRQRDRL